MHIWKTVKVFISSTFKDLELERDQLTALFHRLKSKLHKRHLALIPYDLRWRERDAHEPITKWCVEMVQQCQYFIGILGYRYGWRPPDDAEGNANQMQISITEMEINVAIATIPKHRRFFCFADLRQYSQRDILQESTADRNSLAALKNRLRESGESIYEYSDTETLFQFIAGNLEQIIDTDYPPQKKADFVTYTRQQALAEIIDQKIRGFVGRKEYLQKLLNFASGEGHNYLGICAIAGTGKSSLLAQFLSEWQASAQVPIVAHFMSMGGDSRQVTGVMRSLGEQLQKLQLLKGELQDDPLDLRAQVRSALQNSGRLLIAIDGLDEIEDAGQSLSWLPRNLPQQVRVIITIRYGSTWEQLQTFSRLQTLELPKLADEELAAIIDNYAHGHGMNLEVADKQLLQKRAAGSPLYLKVALEEVISSGIAVGQLAASVDTLFEQILARLQNKYGVQIIEDYLGLIAASRAGLTENEMRELLMLAQREMGDNLLLSVQKSLDNFIVQRGGLLNFFHPEFERSLKQRLGKGGMRNYHHRLADYFARQGHDYDRTLWELCYQQQWAEEYGKLLATLTQLSFWEAKCNIGLIDSLREDLVRALENPIVALPASVTIAHKCGSNVQQATLKLLLKALELDLQFLRHYPQCLAQSLWNRCYWYDNPQAANYYDLSEEMEMRLAPWKRPGAKIYPLVEFWIRHKKQQPGFVWIKSNKPLEPHLDSPLRKLLKGHENKVTSIAFSGAGKYIASGSEDATVKIWDIQTGECLHTICDHEKSVHSVAFSDNGKYVVSGSADWLLVLWNSENGECQQIFSGHEGTVNSVVFAGERIVSGAADWTVRIWDQQSGKCLKVLQKHKGDVSCVAASRNGKYIASASKDQTVRIWDMSSGECLHTLQGHQRRVNSVAFSSDSNYLVSGARDGIVRIWDVRQARCLHVLDQHQGSVTSVAFVGDGNRVVSGSWDRSVKIADVATGDCLYSFQVPEWEIQCIALSPDDKHLACASWRNAVSIWELHGEQGWLTVSGHERPVNKIAYSLNDKYVASGSQDATIRIWEVASGLCRRILRGHNADICNVAFSNDASLIASGSVDRTLRLFDSESGECLHCLTGHKGMVNHVLFNRCDGRYLISGSFYDKTIKLWNVQDGKCVSTMQKHGKWLEHVSFSFDGNWLLSCARDKTIRIWEIETGECLKVFYGHERYASGAAFSRDDSLVVSGARDYTVRVWSIANSSCLRIFRGHTDKVTDVAFSSDNKRVISISRDQTIRIWDMEKAQCLKTIHGQADIEELVNEDKPFLVMARDFISMVISRKREQPLVYFPDEIEQGKIIADKYIVGRSKVAASYVYALEIEGV